MSNKSSIKVADHPNILCLQRGLCAPLRAQTYKNILYLALAFPLGLIYFVGLALGVALGVGLLVTWIGLPILYGTVLAATVASKTEAVMARSLGGVNAAFPTFHTEFDISDELVFPGEGFIHALNHLMSSRTTWTSVGLVLAKFGFGLFSFIVLTVSVTVTGVLLTAPFIYEDPDWALGMGGMIVDGRYSVGPLVVDTLPEALGVAVIGIVFVFLALNLLNSLAQFHAHYTAKLLQGDGKSM